MKTQLLKLLNPIIENYIFIIGKKMEKLIPDAGLVVAHGTGHFSFLENPGLFTAVMKNFFKIK